MQIQRQVPRVGIAGIQTDPLFIALLGTITGIATHCFMAYLNKADVDNHQLRFVAVGGAVCALLAVRILEQIGRPAELH